MVHSNDEKFPLGYWLIPFEKYTQFSYQPSKNLFKFEGKTLPR
jgi:hypothetical protein